MRSASTTLSSLLAKVDPTTTLVHSCLFSLVRGVRPNSFTFTRSQTIAGIAVALKQAATPAFKEYATQIIKNTQTIAAELMKHDYKLCTSGSENHLVLWDLRPLGLTGSKIEKVSSIRL